MEVRLKEAAKWLNENGYKDDLADIASITMKLLENKSAEIVSHS